MLNIYTLNINKLYLSFSLPISVSFFEQFLMSFHQALWINPSGNVFTFRDLNVSHNFWLTIPVERIDLVNSVLLFLCQTTLLRWSIFLFGSGRQELSYWIPNCDSISPLFEPFLFLSLGPSVCSALTFPTLGNPN